MKFGTWLLSMCEPLLARILIALGFSVVSIVGMDSTLSALKTTIIGNFNALPADMWNFALYCWIGKGIGIIFGAIATKMALWAIQNATSLVGKAPS